MSKKTDLLNSGNKKNILYNIYVKKLKNII